MENELNRGLLNKKVGFDRMFEQGLIRVAKIRQKNDAFQKHSGPDVDDEIKEEISAQSQFIEREITELKDLLNQIDNKYKDPESKNKVRQLKADAQKQIERNKIILKEFITTSYIRRSKGKENGDDNENYMEGGTVNYEHLNGHNGHNGNNGHRGAKKDFQKESLLTDPLEERQIEIDYEIERKIALQKNQMITDVEQSTQRIYDIVNDMGVQVQEQGQGLDVISQELMRTNKNMTETNEQLQEASTLQKKAKNKYIFLVILIILIVLGVAGVLYFLLS